MVGGSVRRLLIGGLGLTIKTCGPLPAVFAPFFSEVTGPAGELALVVEQVGEIKPAGRLISREEQFSCWRDGGCESVVLAGFDGVPIGCLTGADEWGSAILCIRTGIDAEAVVKRLGEIYFRTALACRGWGLVLHAAGLAWAGRGLAFVGRSGMGKSTQAGLWEQHRGATILNEDRPAVTLQRGCPELHGTPWSGSSSKRRPMSVPLASLVFLEQAPVNSARQLTPAESIPLLLPRIFMPYWSAAGMEAALTMAAQLVSRVHLIQLRCRPELGAVECLESFLARA